EGRGPGAPPAAFHVAAVRRGRAVHGDEGRVREARRDDLVVRAPLRRRVRPVPGAGLLHVRRRRRHRQERRAPGQGLTMLTVSVNSPERVLFEGEVESVPALAFDGEVGILTSHAPMMTLLGKGTLRLGANGAQGTFTVEGGFLQVVDNHVRVVTEKATQL